MMQQLGGIVGRNLKDADGNCTNTGLIVLPDRTRDAPERVTLTVNYQQVTFIFAQASSDPKIRDDLKLSTTLGYQTSGRT